MGDEKTIFFRSLMFSVGFLLLLWTVKILEWALGVEFGMFGILPRTLIGSMGIITAPLIHGDFVHLLSNTFPLVLLVIAIFYFYNRIALEVFLWIYVMTGVWVWIAARNAYHIGASGIAYGLVAFLFFSGLFRRDSRSVTISLVVIFMYSGMLFGLIPNAEGVSWESHLLGSIAGTFCAFYFRNSEGSDLYNPIITKKDLEEEVNDDNQNDNLEDSYFQNENVDPKLNLKYHYKKKVNREDSENSITQQDKKYTINIRWK